MMTMISKLLPVFRESKHIFITPRLGAAHLPFLLDYKRSYSDKSERGLAKAQERAEVSTDVRPLGEKIKETSRTISYTGVIAAGLGVTAIIFYYVFRELFSSNSPNSIYSHALEKCKNDPRIEDALGSPIKGYGEETSRRRRTHVNHAVYVKDGVEHMRMVFYIKGVRNKGVVELDMKKNEYGNYMCRYILVKLDDYSGKAFIVEDNRAELDRTTRGGNTLLPELNLSQ